MSCKRIQERLSDYVDGELGPLARLTTRFHLGHCGPCRRTLASLEETLRLLRECGRRREAEPREAGQRDGFDPGD